MAGREELIKMIPTYATNYPAGLDIANTIAAAKFYIRPTFTSKAAHFAHVICRDFGHAVKFAAPAGISRTTLFVPHVMHVIRRSSHEQMGRIATRPVVALVANKHSIGDGTIREFVGHYMSAIRLVILAACNTIAGIVDIRLPFPTVIGATTIYSLPKLIGRILERRTMPQTVTSVFALDPVKRKVSGFRNRCYTAASTHAKAGRVWRLGGQAAATISGHVRIVALDKLARFALLITVSRFRNNHCFLAAPAVAIAIWDFIEIGGILGHAGISFVDISHVPGRSNVAGTLSYPHYCSTTEQMCKDGRYL